MQLPFFQLNSEHGSGMVCDPLGLSAGSFAKGDEKTDLPFEEVPSSPGIPGSEGPAPFVERVLGTGCCTAFFYNHSQRWLSTGCSPGPALSAVFPCLSHLTLGTALRELLFSPAPRALKPRLGRGGGLEYTQSHHISKMRGA